MESSKISWVDNADFDDSAEFGVILAEMPGEVDYICSPKGKSKKDFHESLDILPVLTPEQERHLFRKMNFLKCRGTRPDAEQGDLEEARLIRERLVRANLRLLFKLLRDRPHYVAWEDLLSDGEWALWRAVERFDYSRGNRFSTFATRVIRRRIGQRVEMATKKYGVVQFIDDYPADSRPTRTSGTTSTRGSDGSDLEPFLETLSTREKQVVCLRHGLGENETLSLTEVGVELGVSKTRVRQLEQQAYAKLRQFAELAVC